MIELKITGKCAGCPAIDLIYDSKEMKREGKAIMVFPSIKCRNAKLCQRLERYIEGCLMEESGEAEEE